MTVKRLLFILAHPDDETFGPGGTIAKYAAMGHDIYLATATKGEAGMLGDPPVASRENVGEVRAKELECAAHVLGIREVYFMGFLDGKLTEIPTEKIMEKTVYAIRKFRPHVVITFGPGGVSGHPDHVTMSHVSSRSFRASGDPDLFPFHQGNGNLPPWQAKKLYHFEIPDELLQGVKINLSGVPMGSITTVIDTSDYVERKIEAFYCHRTQAKDYGRILSRPGYREFTKKEYFVLADRVSVEPVFPEQDLLQGLEENLQSP